MREDGIQLDRLLITDSATYTPTGVGPAESPRGDDDPPAPVVAIIDDGENGFATTGNWGLANDQGHDMDVRFNDAGIGNDKATWTFTGLTPGLFDVAATWSPQSNRATDAPYTLYAGSVPQATIDVNQELAPGDFTDDGTQWDTLFNSFAVSGTSLTVELTDDADQFVIADAVRIERVGDLPNAPEIEVLEGATTVVDGVSSIDFGSTTVGSPIERTLTIRNVGAANLSLQPLTVPSGFQATQNVAANTILGTNEEATVIVQLTAGSAGQPSGQLSFVNSDSDEDPFNFDINGTVTNTVNAATIDDGDAAFTTDGSWLTANGQGYLDDVNFHAPGNGDSWARWSFTGLETGQYRFAATWSAQANRATDAPYQLDIDGNLTNVDVNQELAPADFEFAGVMWQYLGGLFNLPNGTATIELTDNANQFVIADGVRAIRMGDIPAGPEIEVSFDGGNVQDDVANVDVGNTAIGNAKQVTFTISNVGTADLTLQPVSVPNGFSVVSNIAANTVVAPNGTAEFTVQLNGDEEGVTSGEITFNNSDPDENPFNFNITGNVLGDNAPIIIDNGDNSYTTDGPWLAANDQGFEGDVEFIAGGGDGQNIARWSFTGLTPGVYVPAATWTANANRATDAPFTLFDNNALISSIDINQELPPNDFTDNAVAWERLSAGAVVTSGTLVVELSATPISLLSQMPFDSNGLETSPMRPRFKFSRTGLN